MSGCVHIEGDVSSSIAYGCPHFLQHKCISNGYSRWLWCCDMTVVISIGNSSITWLLWDMRSMSCKGNLFLLKITVPALCVKCSHINKCSTIMPVLLSGTLMAGMCFQLQQNVGAEYWKSKRNKTSITVHSWEMSLEEQRRKNVWAN